MIVIPAIDIKNGKCVRLIQGDPGRETVYHDDPVYQAKCFEDAGAKLIHVVDLDGAFTGMPINSKIVSDIAKSISIPIEIGGGIRSVDVIDSYRNAGISRFIVGTAALEDIQTFKEMIDRFGESIIVGVDASHSKVATHGWQNVSDKSAIDFIKELVAFGVKECIYTDIATDGMLKGPNISAIMTLLDVIPDVRIVASGGVSSIDDLTQLSLIQNDRLIGVIVGKAIYDGRIDLTEAFKV